MLYLAEVKHDFDEKLLRLKLLAEQRSEKSWRVLPEPEVVESTQVEPPTTSGLALVQLTEERFLLEVRDASEWLLGVIRQHLSSEITSDFLKEEADRAEQWRQALTLQSQELGRRTLELEARMSQIQALEERLQQGRPDEDSEESLS